jgi:ArsR family transcriptional regulator
MAKTTHRGRLLPIVPAADTCCDSALPAVTVPPGLTAQLKALADETRLQLLGQIAASAAAVCVCELVDAATVNQPTVSHHLKVLREAGLVDVERRGTWAYYSLRPGASGVVAAVLAELESYSPGCVIPGT